MGSDARGSGGDGLELSAESGVLLDSSRASAWSAQLGVPSLLGKDVSGVNLSLELSVNSLSLAGVGDLVDSGVLRSVLDLEGSLLSSHLELVLSLLGELGDLLLAHLELSSDSVESLLVEVGLDLDSPEIDTGLVGLSPVLESESGDGGSGLDVSTSAGLGLLDSDHFLSLGAPLELLLDSDDLGLLSLNLLVDLGLVNFHVGFNLDTLGDVLPLKALVGLVDFTFLEALTVGSSLEAVVLRVVGLVSGADGAVSALVRGLDGGGGAWSRNISLWILVGFSLLLNLDLDLDINWLDIDWGDDLDWHNWDGNNLFLRSNNLNSSVANNNNWGVWSDDLVGSDGDLGVLLVDDWSWSVNFNSLLVLGDSDLVNWSSHDSVLGLNDDLVSDLDVDDWFSDDFVSIADDNSLGGVDLHVGDDSVSWRWGDLDLLLLVDDDNWGDNGVDLDWIALLVDDDLDVLSLLDDDWGSLLLDDDSWVGDNLNVHSGDDLVAGNLDDLSSLLNLGDWGGDDLLSASDDDLVSNNDVLNLGGDNLIVSLDDDVSLFLDVNVVDDLLSGGDGAGGELLDFGDDDWLSDNLDGLLDVGSHGDGLRRLGPGPSLLVALAGVEGLSANGDTLLGRASLSPDAAALGPTSVALDPLLRHFGVGAPVSGLNDLIDVFGTNLWLSLDHLLGSGVVSDNLGSGELEGELLSFVGHSRDLIIHAGVSLVGKSCTGKQCDNKNSVESHFNYNPFFPRLKSEIRPIR